MPYTGRKNARLCFVPFVTIVAMLCFMAHLHFQRGTSGGRQRAPRLERAVYHFDIMLCISISSGAPVKRWRSCNQHTSLQNWLILRKLYRINTHACCAFVRHRRHHATIMIEYYALGASAEARHRQRATHICTPSAKGMRITKASIGRA